MSESEIVSADGQRVRPFGVFLAEFRRGLLADELSRELHALIGEVAATEKKGRLVLTLGVSPVGDAQIEVTADVAVKAPKPTPPAQLFFVDRDGNPSRHDPYQQQMFNEEES